MEPIYIISWIVLSIIIGAVGANRKIGFAGAFFLSLLLSPLIGLIITVSSKSKDAIQYEQEVLVTQKKQQETLEQIKSQNVGSMADDLKKIKDLLDSKVITEEEFEKMKKKIISNFDNNQSTQDNESKFSNATKIYEEITKEEKIITPKYSDKLIYSNDSFFFSGTQNKYSVDFENGLSGNIYESVKHKKFRIEFQKTHIYYSSKELAIDGLYYNLRTGRVLETERIYI